ncbi:MAG: diguanylate cyclase [Deltaproteobacteria bacterium]|nr:diguanylate cyclase [Deltaproteobacteria bacterium]
MNKKKDTARSIVEGILKEIEQRSASMKPDPAIVGDLQAHLRKFEDKVSLDCTRSIPQKYFARIREMLGDEIIEVLDSGKLGSLVFKNRDRIQQVYKKLAVFFELYRHALKVAEDALGAVYRLQHVQQELVESQIAHVQEVEIYEQRMLRSQMLVDIMLEPFEDGIRRIIGFLGAKQFDVYLFDDDRFLTNELKTDGKVFTYNKQQEDAPELPEAVSSPTFQEVQETIYEMPLMVEGRQIGHYRICRQIMDDFDRDRWIQDVAFITPVAARIIEANHNRLHALKVYTDDLTQLYNKRKLNEQMGRLFKQFKTGQKKLFVAMIDIDRFKIFNDTHGHPAGDEVLKQTALLIRDGVPYAYRYGGEEFCAVFYGHEKQDVIDAMENLRKRIESTPFMISDLEHNITISAGIAEFDTGMNAVMDAIDLADQALYVSKEDGRNRCTYYDDVKGRLASDYSRLRQRNALLEEEIERLRQEVAGKKAGKSR